MAMGRREGRQRQKQLWLAAAEMPKTAAHPFYGHLKELLDEHGLDAFVEQRCEKFYAPKMGRPSLTPGIYSRSLLIGYFEGIDSERGIAWRIADSISLRRFPAIEFDESTPDHSTLSRTRRLIDVETHRDAARPGRGTGVFRRNRSDCRAGGVGPVSYFTSLRVGRPLGAIRRR